MGHQLMRDAHKQKSTNADSYSLQFLQTESHAMWKQDCFRSQVSAECNMSFTNRSSACRSSEAEIVNRLQKNLFRLQQYDSYSQQT